MPLPPAAPPGLDLREPVDVDAQLLPEGDALAGHLRLTSPSPVPPSAGRHRHRGSPAPDPPRSRTRLPYRWTAQTAIPRDGRARSGPRPSPRRWAARGRAGRDSTGEARTIREAVGDEPRGLDRLLDAHAEHHVVQEDLQHGLRLRSPPGAPNGMSHSPPRQRQRRIGRQPRPLARRDAGGVARHRPGLRSARRTDKSPGQGSPGRPTTTSLGVAEMRCLAIDDADVGAYRRRWIPARRRRRLRRAGRRRPTGNRPAGGISGQARVADESPPRPPRRPGEQRVHRDVDEARVAVVALAIGEAELHRLGDEVDVVRRVMAERLQIRRPEQRAASAAAPGPGTTDRT